MANPCKPTAWSRSYPLLLVLLFVIWPQAVAQETCLECHEIDTAEIESSAHGFLDCTDCHPGSEEFPHDEDSGFPGCAVCHDDAVSDTARSPHARTLDDGTQAVDCSSCHVGAVHAILPGDNPASPVHTGNLPDTCGRCHADPELLSTYGIRAVLPIAAYRDSVHARALAEDRGGASCVDCHGVHDLLPSNDPLSQVFRERLPETCGACHAEITRAYSDSVHGRAALHGIQDSPVCTDCHGEHRILSPSEPSSPVYATNIPRMTCGHCHGDLQLAEKFGIAADKVPAYQDSYHGLATDSDVTTVAHCGSCHGIHDIRPSSDPQSHIHESNLAKTCGQCHPGAGRRFAIGSVHVLPTDPEQSAIYYIRLFYLIMIYGVIGGMILHNGLDLFRKMKSAPSHRHFSGSSGMRLLPAFRTAHALLMVSFILLAYTGFALKYPDAWWAAPLRIGGLDLRGGLHRFAAIAMMLALAVHVVHLVVSRSARRAIGLMRPGWGDFAELKERILYGLGRRPDPPHAPTVGYPEKLEYIALMWGIAIMAVTGFALWFENVTLRWLPKSATDIATVIHLYEAILASLAVLFWHLYFVIFDPVVYPMDTAWITGRSHPGRVAERAKTPGTGSSSEGTST